MEKIRVVYSRETNILDVWFDDPKKEAYCSETGDEVILRKDKTGRVMGLEILNFLSPRQLKAGVSKLSRNVAVH